MFWVGFAVGVVIGSFLGIWIACLCSMAAEGDRHILKVWSLDQESESWDPQS